MLRIASLVAAAALLALSAAPLTASAASITVSLPEDTFDPTLGAHVLDPGGKYQVTIDFDFGQRDDKIFGGSSRVLFDDQLFMALDDFTFSSRFPFDPSDPPASFNRPLGFFASFPSDFAFGDFNPFDGDGLVATFTLMVRGDALPFGTTLGVGPGDASTGGPFVDEGLAEVAIDYNTLDILITPEPGTLVLLAAGLAGLGVVRRRA